MTNLSNGEGQDSDCEARFCPHRAFPPYAFVPGVHPHPISNPAGHSFGIHRPKPPCDPANLSFQEEFLFGIDLFNAGYYWEAHEAWECLWISCGRRGQWAVLLQGLIKLAAAGVKARVGNKIGVQRHANRAIELLGETCTIDENLGIGNLSEVEEFAKEIAESPIVDATHSQAGRAVFSLRLVPSITLGESGFQ